jgi:hypothetical protein
MKCCVGCIARCEMQAVRRLGERGIAVEIVTLFTQAIWHVTPSNHTNNCHCTCAFYHYCPVGANNVVLFAGAEHEILRVSHKEMHRLLNCCYTAVSDALLKCCRTRKITILLVNCIIINLLLQIMYLYLLGQSVRFYVCRTRSSMAYWGHVACQSHA